MRKLSAVFMLSSIVGLAACDEVNSDLERAAVGAAIGCAAGYTLVNGRCVEGAVVGGAAGALTN